MERRLWNYTFATYPRPIPTACKRCRMLDMSFREDPTRDCMKKEARMIVRYSSRYEKALPNRSLRCRMDVYRTSRTHPQRTWTAQDPQPAGDPKRHFYLLRSGCQWRMLP